MFRALIEYKNKFGHYKVSEKRKGYLQLGTWVVRMRKAKRHGKAQEISEIQIKLLDSIGFNWEPEVYDWNNNYNKLLKFVNEHGHCLVPIKKMQH